MEPQKYLYRTLIADCSRTQREEKSTGEARGKSTDQAVKTRTTPLNEQLKKDGAVATSALEIVGKASKRRDTSCKTDKHQSYPTNDSGLKGFIL